MTENIIDKLLKNLSFSSLSYSVKLNIIEEGRPTPELKWCVKSGGKTRSFNNAVFSKVKWLTAPFEKPHRLICWPCILFQPPNASVPWTKTGYNDLKNYTTAIKLHEKSKVHLDAILMLHHFGKMEEGHDRLNVISKTRYNDEVTKNRQLMHRLIDITVLLAKQGLAFRGHDEASSSVNRGNYIETMHLLSEYDHLLKEHMENKRTQFKGVSKDTQNELIKCIHDVVADKVNAEINLADFIAVGADETTDISLVEQLITTIRYVDETGKIQERFMGFQSLSGDQRTAAAVAEKILTVCNDIRDCENRLVSQSYDGASVMSGQESGVRAIIRNKFKFAAFLHCFAHRLNLVLMDGARLTEVRRFFCSVRAFHTFFTGSSKRMELLKQCGSESRMRAGSDTRWQYQERAVHAIMDNLDALRKCLQTISDEWFTDHEAVASSRGLISYLNSERFLFLIVVYNDIFNLTGKLFEKLQSKDLDILIAVSSVNDVVEQLSRLRNDESFNEKLKISTGLCCVEMTDPPRRKKRKNFGDSFVYGEGASGAPEEDGLKRLYFETLDQCIQSLRVRFQEHYLLQICDLVDPGNFEAFLKTFPSRQLSVLKEWYGDLLDIDLLKTELLSVYGFKDMRLKPNELLRHMAKYDLTQSFPQTYRLLRLVLTIKPTTVTEERSFSVLKRVKTYLRSTMGQDRLTHLARLQIEANLLVNLQKSGELYEKVITKFGRMKDRSFNLFYR